MSGGVGSLESKAGDHMEVNVPGHGAFPVVGVSSGLASLARRCVVDDQCLVCALLSKAGRVNVMTASLFGPLPSVGEIVSWSRELQAHPDEDQIPRLSQSQVVEVALAGERRLCPDSRGGYAGVLQVCKPHPALEIKTAFGG
jgi:hypothetical protein